MLGISSVTLHGPICMMKPFLVLALVLAATVGVHAQTPPVPALTAAPAIAPAAPAEKGDDSDWVRVEHVATVAGQSIRYQTTAGQMPIRNAKEKWRVESSSWVIAEQIAAWNETACDLRVQRWTGVGVALVAPWFLGPKRVKFCRKVLCLRRLTSWCRTTRACFRKRTS